MLSVDRLALRRGARLLFENATFSIADGHKVGIVGANGTGKSSLFALIRGELSPDAGDLTLPANCVIASVAQEIPASEQAAIEFVLDGDAELRSLQSELAAAEAQGDGLRVAALHERLDAIGGYTATVRAARLMHGLGFESGQERAPIVSFSGGWRMRLNLARALMCRSDLLLLDEPTNHLDLDAVLWLQEWLRRYEGTLLLISHDRDFLDEVVGHILHLDGTGITLYSGNYTAYETLRAEALARQQAAYEKQQREIAHIHRFVERFRAKATKARQAQSRLKTLARMERIAAAHVDSPFHFQFAPPAKLPHPILKLENLAVGYGGTALLQGVNLVLAPGARMGLLGRNGAGKSTLIKLLAGELPPLAGEAISGQGLAVGYFAQHQLEQLTVHATALEQMQRLAPQRSEQELRDYLGGFGFSADRAVSKIETFSGGEKARLVLALLVYQRPNLLLLDEPTNHLDLEMRHALTLALQTFDGAVVLVSHDRYLLRAVADEFLLVHEGRVRPFEGDLDDYRQWLTTRLETEEQSGEPPAEHTATARKARRRDEAEKRQRLKPLRKELEKLEAKIGQLTSEKNAIDAQLADSALYGEDQKVRLKELLLKQASLQRTLEQAEDEWLVLSEQLEQAMAEE